MLEMKHIHKKFPGVYALKDINFELRTGEVHALLGENGAGKSTLIKVLGGIYTADEGEIIINGKKVNIDGVKAAQANGVAIIHQELVLVPYMTVAENIFLGREPMSSGFVDKKKMNHDAQKLLDDYQMGIQANQLIKELTIAQQQMVEIARAVSFRSKLVIMDEPTSSLTDRETQLLFDIIRNLKSNGVSVIFITHRLQEILDVCNKVIVMRDGHVVKDTPAKETNVSDITRWMVGRSVELSAAQDVVDHSGARTIMSIRKLWVDMPGEIVRNVDLDIREGEILGIGGLAGQGKLGIPNGVMGLYEAGGTVEFDGKPIPLNAPRRCLDAQLAFVSEDRRGVGLLLDESLEWNVAFPAMQIHNKFLKDFLGGLVKWRDEKAIRAVTDRYIDELKIKCTSSKQKAKELSGGNQQKVCLAKAFALEPKFLFVSEPTRGIDVGAKSLVLDALKRFNRESGITVVMISSELEELRTTCDRIAIVSGGRIAGILPATESSEAFGMLMVSQVK